MGLGLSWVAVATVLLQAGGTAPQSEAAHRDDIVVEHRAIEKKAARDFTRDVTTPVERQLPRFLSRACPKAIGFGPRLGPQIEARMRANVAAAGAPLGAPGCKGTMVVIAADQGGQMVREMRRLGTHLIRGLDSHELDALIASPEPVRSWTLTAPTNERNEVPAASMSNDAAVQGGRDIPVVEVWESARMRPNLAQGIQMAVVVIDWAAMMGKSPEQIADYATMRTLAKTRAPATGGVGTILTLFRPGEGGTPEMTGADRALLKGLYSLQPRQNRTVQTNVIATAIAAGNGAGALPAP